MIEVSEGTKSTAPCYHGIRRAASDNLRVCHVVQPACGGAADCPTSLDPRVWTFQRSEASLGEENLLFRDASICPQICFKHRFGHGGCGTSIAFRHVDSTIVIADRHLALLFTLSRKLLGPGDPTCGSIPKLATNPHARMWHVGCYIEKVRESIDGRPTFVASGAAGEVDLARVTLSSD